MLKIKFENGKEFQKDIDKMGRTISKAKGEILNQEQLLPNLKVASSNLNALYDALYLAKLEEDTEKMEIIIEEILNIADVNISEIIEQIADRKVNEFLKDI